MKAARIASACSGTTVSRMARTFDEDDEPRPKSSYCVAIDPNRAFTFDGHRWSAPRHVDQHNLRSISCASDRWVLPPTRQLNGSVVLRDCRGGGTGRVTSSSAGSAFAGFLFPREVISLAVRWYLRCGLSYRDVEELLAGRGVDVDHVSIYRWVQRFRPDFVEAARPRRHVPGDRWFVDETYVRVSGRWTYLYRAIDQYGQVVDVWLSCRPDLAAARAFFRRVLAMGTMPVEITTDRAPPPRVTRVQRLDQLRHRPFAHPSRSFGSPQRGLDTVPGPAATEPGAVAARPAPA